jgi:phosphoribosylaminoimidazole-succinocarboxamide synthase
MLVDVQARVLPKGKVVAEGKTKKILLFNSPLRNIAAVISGDGLTAQDGKKRDSFAGKGAISTSVACRNFEMLRRHGIPLAYYEQWSDNVFLAPYLKMIPLEIVVRYKVGPKSSYLKRFPDAVKPGHEFGRPVVEFFLKTTNGKFGKRSFPCDDPYLDLKQGTFSIYYPNRPLDRENLIGTISLGELGLRSVDYTLLTHIAFDAGVVYREGWKAVGVDIHDWKGEAGKSDGKIMLGDVIDNDSHRAYFDGEDRSKQGYRDDMPMEKLAENYKLIAALAEKLPF